MRGTVSKYRVALKAKHRQRLTKVVRRRKPSHWLVIRAHRADGQRTSNDRRHLRCAFCRPPGRATVVQAIPCGGIRWSEGPVAPGSTSPADPRRVAEGSNRDRPTTNKVRPSIQSMVGARAFAISRRPIRNARQPFVAEQVPSGDVAQTSSNQVLAQSQRPGLRPKSRSNLQDLRGAAGENDRPLHRRKAGNSGAVTTLCDSTDAGGQDRETRVRVSKARHAKRVCRVQRRHGTRAGSRDRRPNHAEGSRFPRRHTPDLSARSPSSDHRQHSHPPGRTCPSLASTPSTSVLRLHPRPWQLAQPSGDLVRHAHQQVFADSLVPERGRTLRCHLCLRCALEFPHGQAVRVDLHRQGPCRVTTWIATFGTEH